MNDYFDVKESMAAGIRWLGLSKCLHYSLQFVITIFLARILFPKDFGIISIALLINNLLIKFKDLGFDAALVQKKDISQQHLSPVFWFSLSLSLFFFALVVLAAPLIAKFFNNPIIGPVVILMSVKFVLDSLGTIQIAFLKNKLCFGKLALAEISEMSSYGVVSIFLALRGFGIWSLVSGYLVGSLVSLIILWGISSWRPVFKFYSKGFKGLFKFSRDIFGYHIFHHLAGNIDFFMIGKLLGVVSLGFYSLIYNIAYFPRLRLSFIVSVVAFPVFSKIQDDLSMMQRNYLKIVKYISVITFPLLFGLIAVAYPFIKVVFGQKWLPVVPLLSIFSIAGIFYSITTFSPVIFLASGRSDLNLRYSIIYLLTLFLAVLLGLGYGLKGIVIAISMQAVLMNIVAQIMVKIITAMSLGDYFRSIFPAFFSALFMVGILILFLKKMIFAFNDSTKLVMSIILGGAVYLLIFYLIDKQCLREIKENFYKIIGAKINPLSNKIESLK